MEGNLVAVLPATAEFDDEAEAARKVLPVVRFEFGLASEEAEVVGGAVQREGVQRRGILRGYMQTAARREALHRSLQRCGITLMTTPAEYTRGSFYPLHHEHLGRLAPRALWTAVPNPDTVTHEQFADTVQVLQKTWPEVQYVMLKDYMKSAKASPEGRALQKVSLHGGDLAVMAVRLVKARLRDATFHGGVVFKEHVELAKYLPAPGSRVDFCLNEWRLWFVCGELVSMAPNSFQPHVAELEGAAAAEEPQDPMVPSPPPPSVVDRAAAAAAAIDSPYLTIDLAEGVHSWIALEAGDGSVSGLAPGQDIDRHWQHLHRVFSRQGRGEHR